MTIVLKLGGSVVTAKSRDETVDDDALARAAGVIAAAAPDRLVVVHGGGSFGHPAAAAHGVTASSGTRDATAVRAIHRAMCRLNEAVVDSLAAHEVPAIPIHPLSMAARTAGGELQMDPASVTALLESQFVPVLHGDVVAHASAGAVILSGDEIVVTLATALPADRVGLCSAVPGVLDESGAVLDQIGTLESVPGVVGESGDLDVTGGMAGKVRTLLAGGVTGNVFGLDDLEVFLAGGEPGTRVG